MYRSMIRTLSTHRMKIHIQYRQGTKYQKQVCCGNGCKNCPFMPISMSMEEVEECIRSYSLYQSHTQEAQEQDNHHSVKEELP